MKPLKLACFIFIIILSTFSSIISSKASASVTLSDSALIRGDIVRVTWAGFSGNVNIFVYKGNNWWVDACTQNCPGSGFQDLDTTGWELRSDYRVKIELKSNPAVYYEFSTSFSVSYPAVSLSSTSVIQGEVIRANWSGFSGNVNVRIYKGNNPWVYACTQNCPGTGSQDLDTTGWEERSDYRVKIELKSYTTIYKFSSYFSVTIPTPDPPTLTSPADNSTIPPDSNITFQWINSSPSVTNSSIKQGLHRLKHDEQLSVF